MTTINIGPLSFSTPVFISIVALMTLVLSSWLADRRFGTNTESVIWKVVLAALVAGRGAFVLRYLDLYRPQPLDMLDLRDGGFSVAAAAVAGTAVIVWSIWRLRGSRKPLLLSIVAGLSVLGMGHAIPHLFAPPKPVIADVLMTTLDGHPVPVSHFHGKPTVINLWASWCPPCRREMPALQEGQKSNPDIHFVFANQGEDKNSVGSYLSQEGLELDNVLLDIDGNLALESSSRGLPTTLFLNHKGQLVDIRLGELSSATLQNRLNALRATGAPVRSSKD